MTVNCTVGQKWLPTHGHVLIHMWSVELGGCRGLSAIVPPELH